VLCCGLLYLTTAIRTMSYGMSPMRSWPLILGMYTMFSTVCAIPLLLAGFRMRVCCGVVLSVGILVFIMSESIAGVEEHVFRRQCQQSQVTETIFQERWWPFRHHYLGYNPTTQQFFGGD